MYLVICEGCGNGALVYSGQSMELAMLLHTIDTKHQHYKVRVEKEVEKEREK